MDAQPQHRSNAFYEWLREKGKMVQELSNLTTRLRAGLFKKIDVLIFKKRYDKTART